MPDSIEPTTVWILERGVSLPKKTQRLRQLCRPQPDWDVSIKFKELELERIDGLRHAVVHVTSLAIPPNDRERFEISRECRVVPDGDREQALWSKAGALVR